MTPRTEHLPSGAFTLTLRLAPLGHFTGPLLTGPGEGGQPALELARTGGTSDLLRCIVRGSPVRPACELVAPLGAIDPMEPHALVIRHAGHRIDLFVDGVLLDEDWPVGHYPPATGPLQTAAVVRGLEVTRTLGLGEAQLTLRLDRVDALEAGGLAVLDYKSGEPKPLQWYGDRPAPAQLMAYLAALGGEVRALVNAHLTQRLTWRKPAYYGVADEGGLLPGVRAVAPPPDGAVGSAWAYWVGRWNGELTQLAGAFLRGDAAVLPAKGACRHCHLATLCRVGERAQADGGDAPPEEAGDD